MVSTSLSHSVVTGFHGDAKEGIAAISATKTNVMERIMNDSWIEVLNECECLLLLERVGSKGRQRF